MSFSNAIVEAGVVGLSELYRSRVLTPTEAAEAFISRIERLDGPLNSYTHLDVDGARSAAQASAARWSLGAPLSPLDGVPLAVKANIAVRGLPWHAGVAAYRDRLAPTDAAVVARLKAGGAVILGLLNMHEGALGATTDNVAFGRCHNPHRHGFTPGGSSGGSASATAAGLCAAALGADTMGSVRIPASYCGVFGHKPRERLLPTSGVIALSWTLDQVGVLARSAADAATLLAAASEVGALADDQLPATRDLLDARPWAVLEFSDQVEVESGVAAAFQRTVETAGEVGLELRPVRLADHNYTAVRRLMLLICEVEGAVEHEAALARDDQGFTPELRSLFAWGTAQPATRLAKAYRDLTAIRRALRDALTPYAGLLAPTTPQTSFSFEAAAPANVADFTILGSISGLAATAFPVTVDADALPVSVQVIGWEDGSTLALAQSLAAAVVTPLGFRA